MASPRPLERVCFFRHSPEQKKAVWEITHRCNARCPHCCSNAGNARTEDLGLSDVLSLVRSLRRDFDISEVYFTGGEPFCREDIWSILDYARRQFRTIYVATNGHCLTRDTVERIADVGLDSIGISLDFPRPQEHDRFRGIDGLFERIRSGIDGLLENSVRVRLLCTISVHNFCAMEDLVWLAAKWGVREILFNWVLPLGRGKEMPYGRVNGAEGYVEFLLAVEDLRKKCEDKDIRILHRRSVLGDLTPLESCPGGRSVLYVSPEGAIGPCPWIAKRDPEFLVARETWMEAKRRGSDRFDLFAAFHQMLELRGRNIVCSRCEISGVCGKGCPALSRLLCGIYSLPDPLCPAASDSNDASLAHNPEHGTIWGEERRKCHTRSQR
jgi:radical SAM protein with 4Fe4S-binding SPASM domain